MAKDVLYKLIAAVIGVIVFLFMLSVVLATLLYNIIMGGSFLPLSASARSKAPKIAAVKPTEPISKEMVKYRGIIRSDPEYAREVDLGKDWYWLYFDKPQHMDPGARGEEIDVKRLEIGDVVSTYKIPNDPRTILKSYVNKHVEVTGYLEWGYAESRVIAPIVITELP